MRKRRKRVSNESADKGHDFEPQQRKRRRRSKQPVGGQVSLKTQKLQFYTILIVFLTGFFLMLAGTFSIAYHNSATYRSKFLADISSASGSSVAVESLKISPTVAKAREITFQWPTDSLLLNSLTFHDVSADYIVGGLLGGSWGNTSLLANKGDLVLSLLGDQPLKVNSAAGFSEVESIRCRDFSVHLKDSSEPFLVGANAHYRWSGEPNKLLLTGGKVSSEFLAGFSLEQGFLRFDREGIAVSLRLEEDKGRGAVSLEGIYDLDVTSRIEMKLKAEKLDAKFLMGEHLGDLFRAHYDSSNGSLALNLVGDSPLQCSLDCTSADIELGRFDCFSVLAETLSKSWYRRPRFTDGGELTVTKAAGVTSLSNIKLVKKGALIVEGSMKVTLNGDTEGELRIGIPSKYQDQLSRSFKDGTFTSDSNGYVWTVVKISGAQELRKDNLRSQLLSRSEMQPIPIKKSVRTKAARKLPTTQEELEQLFEELISK